MNLVEVKARQTADTRPRPVCRKMESKKEAPVITHYRVNVLRLVLWMTLAVSAGIAVQFLR